MIINAIFQSVWDGGYTIETPCKINTETKEVFDIEPAPGNCEAFDVLEGENVIINDEEYPVFQYSDIVDEDDEYWYE